MYPPSFERQKHAWQSKYANSKESDIDVQITGSDKNSNWGENYNQQLEDNIAFDLEMSPNLVVLDLLHKK